MSSVEYLREFVSERLTAAAEEIFGVFKQTIVEYEEEIDRQRRLLDIVWKPEIKLYRIELQHVCQEEEVFTDQQLCIQERNSSLDQEDPEPPQIKEEQEELCTSQEGEQLVLKQETETFMLTPTDEDSDHSEDRTLNLNSDETLISEEKESLVNIKVNMVSEPNNDHWLLSHNSHVADSQDLRGGEHGSSGSTRDAEPEQNNQHNESRSHTNNGYSSTMSVIHYNTEPEPRSDHQLLSTTSQVAKRKDPKGGTHGGSTRDAEPEPKKRDHKSSKHRNNGCNSNLADVQLSACTSKMLLQCDTCGKDFKYKSLLQRHLRIHTGEKPYTCSSCGKGFSKTSDLNVHIRIHTGEKPFICTTCGRAFTQNGALTVHIRRVHTGEKPYICKICGTGFFVTAALKRHVIMHTGEKPHLCKTCGKRFLYVSTLKKHMTIHTGEKPYTCTTCGRAFRQSSNLTDHMRRAHTGERP